MEKVLIKCQVCKSKSFYKLKLPIVKPDPWKKQFNLRNESEWKICRGCGLVFQNPRFSEETLINFYKKSSYRDENFPNEKDIKFSKRVLKRFEFLLNKMGIDLNFKNANLLDFGCGIGAAFEFLDNSNKCFGIELDQKLLIYANNNFNIKVYDNLESIKNIKFDFIFTNHALEHMYDPNKFFEFVNTNLKDEGVLVIVLPTYFSGNHPDTLMEFNYTHLIMIDHISLSKWLNKYNLNMCDYKYIQQINDIELIAVAVKSKDKNNYNFKISNIIEEIEINIKNRIKERFSLRWATGNDNLIFDKE